MNRSIRRRMKYCIEQADDSVATKDPCHRTMMMSPYCVSVQVCDVVSILSIFSYSRARGVGEHFCIVRFPKAVEKICFAVSTIDAVVDGRAGRASREGRKERRQAGRRADRRTTPLTPNIDLENEAERADKRADTPSGGVLRIRA